MTANDTARSNGHETTEDLQERIARALKRSHQTVAAAESLTGGNISAGLSAIQGASDWFLGAVVAYGEQVKFDVLGVEPGPVINDRTARQMATGVSRLLGADFTVATTGVGGPGPQEGTPQGTVFIAVRTPQGAETREYRFEGEPNEVVTQATEQALRDLGRAIGVD